MLGRPRDPAIDDAVLAAEAGRGTKALAVAAPGFSADCLETLEELLSQTSHFTVCGDLRMSGMPEVGPISVPLRMTPAAH